MVGSYMNVNRTGIWTIDFWIKVIVPLLVRLAIAGVFTGNE